MLRGKIPAVTQHSPLPRTADHSLEPVVDSEAAEVMTSDLLTAFAQTPRLATAILWAASRDEAMVVEHLVGLGRRDAVERLAHYLLEPGAKLTLVGIGSNYMSTPPWAHVLPSGALSSVLIKGKKHTKPGLY